MNYRQWKKNYKKKHGVNPPLMLDKRKQAKVMKRMLKNIKKTNWQQLMNQIVQGYTRAIGVVFQAAGDAISKLGKNLQEIFENAQ